MQIFGGSIDVGNAAQQAADTFLHAGYISAYPRAFELEYLGELKPALDIDLVEAFRLQGETVAQAFPSHDGIGFAAAVASSGEWWLTALGISGFFVALVAAFLWRDRLARSGLAGRVALVALLAGIAMPGVTCTEPLPDDPPWEETELKAYENPELATQGLLHGIIADGIINVGQPVDRLANIEDEVGLPTTTPTPGMEYALETYGIDGWGRDFRLTKLGKGQYEVRSAGPDGAFDNGDDLLVKVEQADNESWDQLRHGLFVRKVDSGLALFFHRWSGGHFEYVDEETAKAATGGKLFYLFDQDKLAGYPEYWLDPVQACYQNHAADHEPLVLLVQGSLHTP